MSGDEAMGFSLHLPFLLSCCHVASVLKIKEQVNVIGVMLSNSIAKTTTLYDTSELQANKHTSDDTQLLRDLH